MILFACVAAVVASVPLLGGRLSALAALRPRAVGLLALAGMLQVGLALAPSTVPLSGLRAVHVASYLLVAGAVVANRKLPGIVLLGLGGGANFLAIAANGGVMPAAPAALRTAGLTADAGMHNSGAVEGARLLALGDVFAIPAGWPLANVFSIGDVLLVVGLAVLLYRACGVRLPVGVQARLSERLPHRRLRANRDFTRLWAAQAVSGIGDWIFTLTVVASVAEAGAAHIMATLLICQAGPAALTGLVGGLLVDRLDRRHLMVGADLVRAVAVGSLLIVGTPGLGHLYAVAVVLGVMGALFQPSLHASIPDVVTSRRDVVAANSVLSATFHLAVTAGPLVGGVLVTAAGSQPAFALNALSFALSALLVSRVALPAVQSRSAVTVRRGLVEGLRCAVATPWIRGLLVVTALVMIASALKAPLEPLLVLDTLGQPAAALGTLGAAWGFGMLVGAIVAPLLVRIVARERLLLLSIVGVGVVIIAAARVTALPPLIALWFLGGIGNGVGALCHETLLQERTPSLLRGRVIAASEALMDGAYLLGVVVAGWLGGAAGIRGGLVVAGLVFLAIALVAARLLPVPSPAETAADPVAEPASPAGALAAA